MGASDETRDWLEGLPALLCDAVQVAVVDLQHPTPVPLEKVTYEADPGGGDSGLLTVWFAEGGGGGFGLDLGRDRAEVIAAVADGIQELFQEEPEAWAQARPPCPGHSHPPVAISVDGAACWVCPREQRVIARVGHLMDVSG